MDNKAQLYKYDQQNQQQYHPKIFNNLPQKQSQYQQTGRLSQPISSRTIDSTKKLTMFNHLNKNFYKPNNENNNYNNNNQTNQINGSDRLYSQQSQNHQINQQISHKPQELKNQSYYSKNNNIQQYNSNQNIPHQQLNQQNKFNHPLQPSKQSDKYQERIDNLDKNNPDRHFKQNYTNKEISFLQKMEKYHNSQPILNMQSDELSQKQIKELDDQYARTHISKKNNSKFDKKQDHYNQMSNDEYYLLDLKDRPDYQKNLIRFKNAVHRNPALQRSKEIMNERKQQQKLLGYNIISNHNVMYNNSEMPQNPIQENLNTFKKDNKIQDKIDKQYVQMPHITQQRNHYMKLYDHVNQSPQSFNRKAIITNNLINEI